MGDRRLTPKAYLRLYPSDNPKTRDVTWRREWPPPEYVGLVPSVPGLLLTPDDGWPTDREVIKLRRVEYTDHPDPGDGIATVTNGAVYDLE